MANNKVITLENIDDTILNGREELLQVMTVTRPITNWSDLSLLMGLQHYQYTTIQKNASNPQMEIIQKWFDKGEASWASLAAHLCNPLVDNFTIAKEIATNHRKIDEARPLASVQLSSSSSAEPSLNHSKELTSLQLYRLLQNKSANWDEIGRQFNISENDRDGLRHDPALTKEARLERVLVKWLESSYPSPTWSDFMKILTDHLKFGDVAQSTLDFVKTIPR